jgi:hypothetical protein
VTIRYRGHNPVGQALAADADGAVRDALLHTLERYLATVTQGLQAASTPEAHRRQLAAAQCAGACAAVIKEFHAFCRGAGAERAG